VLRRISVLSALTITAGATADPAPHPSLAPVPAWQAFAVPPARSSLERPPPPWINHTSVGLTLQAFDDRVLTGAVVLVAAPGLDANTCAVEIIWDLASKQGARLVAPPVIGANVGGQPGTRATWQFTTPVAGSLPAVRAVAYVFCPLNNAHIDRPWGVTFSTGDTVIGGPRAGKAYCSLPAREAQRAIESKIRDRRMVELTFACGALIRRRGHALIDACRGDVLIVLDDLGPGLVMEPIVPEGTPLTIDELSSWLSGSPQCDRVRLTFEAKAGGKFGAKANSVFAGFLRKAGKRLIQTSIRDHQIMRHPVVE